MERARHYGAMARDALELFPPSDWKKALFEVGITMVAEPSRKADSAGRRRMPDDASRRGDRGTGLGAMMQDRERGDKPRKESRVSEAFEVMHFFAGPIHQILNLGTEPKK